MGLAPPQYEPSTGSFVTHLGAGSGSFEGRQWNPVGVRACGKQLDGLWLLQEDWSHRVLVGGECTQSSCTKLLQVLLRLLRSGLSAQRPNCIKALLPLSRLHIHVPLALLPHFSTGLASCGAARRHIFPVDHQSHLERCQRIASTERAMAPAALVANAFPT